jgi:Zn-dependent protease/predicted transcriptional regulator
LDRWSWKIGTLAGIPVRVHATFFLIFAWVALQAGPRGGWVGVLLACMFISLLIGCVLLHELGHALAARRLGIGTRDITLLPIGGLARLEQMPRDPKRELLIALAGPVVNLLIAALLFGVLSLNGMFSGLQAIPGLFHTASFSFLQQLMLVNLFLAAFNMLPAFPMDGGRVLRALLASGMSYPRATRIAATVGQIIAFVFFLVGLLPPTNPMLMLISVFVWFGASQEAGAVERSLALDGVRVRSAMLTHFRSLSPADTLSQAVELILSGSQQDFPVLERDRLLGLLTRHDIIQALSRNDEANSVTTAMRTQFPFTQPQARVEEVLLQLQEDPNNPTMPVMEGDRLVGLLTLENVSEFLMIQSAVGSPHRAKVV